MQWGYKTGYLLVGNSRLLLNFDLLMRRSDYRPDHQFFIPSRPFALAKPALTASLQKSRRWSVRPGPLTFSLILGYNC